jgi:oligoendopeptidase F
MVIDPPLALECLRIPHFYSAFYVYKYATGISAAIALARGVVEERSGAVEAYLDFLSKGGSQYPLDQLSGAGVDMASPEPVREAVAHFEELVGDFASALERLRS